MSLSPSSHADTFCRDHLPPEDQWPQMLYDLPELQYPTQLNAATRLLDQTVARLGRDRTALKAPGQVDWSYGDLLDRSNQVAHLLTDELGLVPGNRVLLRAPNNPWLVAVWLGTLKAGGVVVLTMPLLRKAELVTTIEIARPDVAISDHRFMDEIVAARDAQAPGVPVLAYGGDAADDLVARVASLPTIYDDVLTSADDVALLAPTSGTTGRPKLTMHFHRDILANADTFSRFVLKPTSDDVFTTTAPFAFTFGLGSALVFPLHVGGAAALVEKATPAELARHVADLGVTILSTAPTAYKAMIATGNAPLLSGVRRMVSAGETLSKPTSDAVFEATGLRVIDGIGATEMLHIFISAGDDDIRPGSTGRPVPGYVAAVLDPEGNPVPDGEPGRLAVKGPTGCRYLADDRQAVYVQDGWNITGDTYVRDAEGYFWYQARSDDMIVSSGYNIAGPEVETALLSHAAVVECAVIGVPDEARGQLVTAFVVLAPDVDPGEATCKELQDHVKATIAPYKYPRAVVVVDSLPKTMSGKLQRYRLRAEAAASHAG